VPSLLGITIQNIIYPNPAKEQINISFDAPSTGQISLIDVSGKVVLVEQIHGKELALDLSVFNAGIYMLAIQTDFYSAQKKIVLEK
jgi:hypothetical protein